MFVLKNKKNIFLKIADKLDQIFNSKHKAILKVDKSSIKILIAQKNKDVYKINFADLIFVEDLIDKDGLVKDKELFKFFLKESFKKANIKIKNILGITPEEETFYKIFSLSSDFEKEKNKEGKIHSLITLDFEPVFDIKEFKPVFRYDSHYDYSLWAINKNYLESYYELLKSLGVSLEKFEPENKMIVKALFRTFGTLDAVLIISISAERTVLIVFGGRGIHISTYLQFGLNSFSKNEKHNEFIEELEKIVLFYNTKSYHEHGASPVVNRIFLIGDLPEVLNQRIGANLKIEIEKPNIPYFIEFENDKIKEMINNHKSDFLPLIGGMVRDE